MLENITIENFRGIKKLHVNNFKNINIFVGKNSSGKTSLLEAIFLAFKPYGASLFQSLHAARNLPNMLLIDQSINGSNQPLPVPLWHSLLGYLRNNGSINANTTIETNSNFGFPINRNTILKPSLFAKEALKQDASAFEYLNKSKNSNFENSDFFYVTSRDTIKLKNKKQTIYFSNGFGRSKSYPEYAEPNNYYDQESKKYKDSIIDYSQFKIFYYPTNINNSSTKDHYNLLTDAESEQIIKLIQIVDPKIKDFRFDKHGSILASIENGTEKFKLPLGLLGYGVQKIFSLLCTMKYCKNGILLIDEIENGLHHELQEEFLSALILSSQIFNVQIFAATHSKEFLESLANVLPLRAKNAVELFRIYNDKIVKYDEESLKIAIQNDLEVR